MPAPNERCAPAVNPASPSTVRSSSGCTTSFASRSTSTADAVLVIRGNAEAGKHERRGRSAQARAPPTEGPPRTPTSDATRRGGRRAPCPPCAIRPSALGVSLAPGVCLPHDTGHPGVRDTDGGTGHGGTALHERHRSARFPTVRGVFGDGGEHGGRAGRMPRRGHAAGREPGVVTGLETADRAGTRRPPGLRLVGVRQRRLLPQGGEEVPLGAVREGDRRHSGVRAVRERRHRPTPRSSPAPATTSRTRAGIGTRTGSTSRSCSPGTRR